MTLKEKVKQYELSLIIQAIIDTNFNVKRAARNLGISHVTIYRILNDYADHPIDKIRKLNTHADKVKMIGQIIPIISEDKPEYAFKNIKHLRDVSTAVTALTVPPELLKNIHPVVIQNCIDKVKTDQIVLDVIQGVHTNTSLGELR